MKSINRKTLHIGHVVSCQICENIDLKPVLSLGHQPIVQEYLTEAKLGEPEVTYPLNLVFCSKCGLTQIDHIPPPEVVFPPTYPYRTGLTNMLIRNFRSLAEALEQQGYVYKGGLIIDIGSNDGTLLEGFKEKGMHVVGVEPTGAADVANKKKIPTLKSFLNAKTVSVIRKKYGVADIVTATNVFAHINDTKSLVKNIASLLGKHGVFVSESQYLVDILEKVEFDTIYHEHLRFYALKPLMRLFALAGMSIIHAERISAAGGSIRVYAKVGKHPLPKSAQALLAEEESLGLYNDSALQKFAKRVIEARRDLNLLLFKLKKSGASIVGLTSAARSNTLLGYMRLYPDTLDYLGEKKGSPKIGLYTPGTHILVEDEAKILKDQPDYVLVLSWHIGKELIQKMKGLGYRGKFIIPLPSPKIVS